MGHTFDWDDERDCRDWMDAQDQLQEMTDDEEDDEQISLDAEVDEAQTPYEEGWGYHER